MKNTLQIENLTKSFGEKVLFSDISFSIGQGQKTALIAQNGAGKTSLINIITGKDTPDSGSVFIDKGTTVGLLSQETAFDDNKTVMEQVFTSSEGIVQAVKSYEEAVESGDTALMAKASEAMDRLQAWDYEQKIKQILDKLEITNLSQLVSQLSGGQKKRLALANSLINNPDFLILDEPTNHLDFEMIEWLEEFLLKAKITLLLVTHDRYFLDRVCTRIIEIDNQSAYTYKGNYSYYVDKRADRVSLEVADVEKAKNLLRRESEWMNRMPQARATKAQYRIDSFYKLKDKASKQVGDKELKLEIETRRLGKKILELDKISKKFDDLVILDEFSYKFTRGEKIGIAGKNGVGKSTFLNIITQSLSPDSGIVEIGETVVYGYYTQAGIKLSDDMRIIDVIKEIAEYITLGNGKDLSASQFLEYFLFPPNTHYSYVSRLSGGERRRLYLMTIFMKNPNFLILDEPTNDLDIMTLNVLEDYLNSFAGCLIVVSHDRYFTDKVADNLLVFEGDGVVRNFMGNYSAYRQEKIDKIASQKRAEKKEVKPKVEREKSVQSQKKMSYKEKTEFANIEGEIEKLSEEKAQIEEKLNSGTASAEEISEIAKRLSEIIETIDEKEFRWLELSEMDS